MFHDKITVDWSTKFTVRFCGAEGGSETKTTTIQIHKQSAQLFKNESTAKAIKDFSEKNLIQRKRAI